MRITANELTEISRVFGHNCTASVSADDTGITLSIRIFNDGQTLAYQRVYGHAEVLNMRHQRDLLKIFTEEAKNYIDKKTGP